MLCLSAPPLHTSTIASSLVGLVLSLSFVKCNDEDYCDVTCDGLGTHTMCLFPTMEPGPDCKNYDKKRSVLTEKKKIGIVHYHNQLRSRTAMGKEHRGNPGPQPKAANMMELVWDEEMERIAHRYALQCIYEHDACRDAVDFTPAGQNIAIKTGRLEHYLSHFELMYDEVKDFDKAVVDKFDSPDDLPVVSHYTQIVWAESTSIGCAISMFEYKEYGTRFGLSEFIVCNYRPSGNWRNEKVYKRGVPCSQCPDGLECSKTYQGLCENPKTARNTKGRGYSKTAKSSTSYNVPSSSSKLFTLFIQLFLLLSTK